MYMHFNTSRGFNPSPEVARPSEPLMLPFYIAESSMKSLWHWQGDTAALQAGWDQQHPQHILGHGLSGQCRGAHTPQGLTQGSSQALCGCREQAPSGRAASPHTSPWLCWRWYLQRSTASSHQAALQTNCSVSVQFQCVKQPQRTVFSWVNTNLVPRKDATSVWWARIYEKLVYLWKISSDNMD